MKQTRRKSTQNLGCQHNFFNFWSFFQIFPTFRKLKFWPSAFNFQPILLGFVLKDVFSPCATFCIAIFANFYHSENWGAENSRKITVFWVFSKFYFSKIKNKKYFYAEGCALLKHTFWNKTEQNRSKIEGARSKIWFFTLFTICAIAPIISQMSRIWQ